MLYSKNSSDKLNIELFKNPTSEYRGTPFWSWNCKLNKDLLLRQIDYLKQMGFGGFHMHSRTGMATNYLSDEFMDLVKFCVDKARNEDMLAWLYDEDRWPSGAAGGLVTKKPKYRIRKLIFTPYAIDNCQPKDTAIEKGGTYFVACYDIRLNNNGELVSYNTINVNDVAKYDKWYAYCATDESDPWYNNETYIDTLNKDAIDKFIEITHEKYKKTVGSDFGGVIPAIFTDEPQFKPKETLIFATDKKNISIAWTNDLNETFKNSYGVDLIQNIPQLVWELEDNKISKLRYLYHDHVAERFAVAFADNIGGWCEQNNIMLTGHMMEEPTLHSQTRMIGDAMRSYRSFQLMGIDMLCNSVELTTAKQAQSTCHQYGREGVLSELYGVTNWDFDFRGHKFQCDWQAALGVTVRVPHLSWVSMAGEAKRDYPASISYQSPWYKEYPYIENHFARVNTAITRGKPIVDVAVIHPIESYWLHYGPNESTYSIRNQMDENFQNITKWLLLGQVDFDYICESLLPSQCTNGDNPLQVGVMEYKTVIVPSCETLRKTTFERLVKFKQNGGRLIFVGECPKYIDAQCCDEVKKLYNISEVIPINKAMILAAFDKDKLVDIKNYGGNFADNFIYNYRQDNNCRWLFIAQAVKNEHIDVVKPQNIIIKIKGEFTPILFDTLTGETKEIDYYLSDKCTIIKTIVYLHESILLQLNDKSDISLKLPTDNCEILNEITIKEKVSYKRSEPNILLLDTAQYSFDDGQYNDEDEILIIENKFRKLLGYPPKMDAIAQPWTYDEEILKHYITLKFKFDSEIEIKNAQLAIEDLERLEITFNDNKVENVITGYYVDESIKTTNLPTIIKGENILTVKIPYGKTANVEYCYILGEFNVKVEGCTKTLTSLTDKIGFNSITNQGMPFYGGNIVYKFEVETPQCDLMIKSNYYRGALIDVKVDGKPAGKIVFAPYKVIINSLSQGVHTVEMTLFGNRFNTFGALHNINSKEIWYGPNYWRSTEDAWSYEYKLRDTGILASPTITILK